jgi:hypothetical protein
MSCKVWFQWGKGQVEEYELPDNEAMNHFLAGVNAAIDNADCTEGVQQFDIKPVKCEACQGFCNPKQVHNGLCMECAGAFN